MDFHSFTRKALQALCKQNGIPANITNVAMADSLAALPHVEGLQELLSQSPEKSMSVLRTAAKTTVRRKAAEPESSQPMMARTTARRAAVAAPEKATAVNVEEAEDQEMMMTEVPPKTPAAAPSTRRRAAAPARQSLEIPTETMMTSVQRAYSTRRSVRLLGKTMSKMSLDKESDSVTSSIEELSADTINCSEQSESSFVKGSDMQTVSDMDMSSKGIDASDVSSELKSVDDSMLKQEVPALKLASAVDVISEAMDESIEESSVEANKTADDDKEGTQDLVVVKESEEVTDVKIVEPIKVTLRATPIKSPVSKSLDMDVEAPKAEALADYGGKFDFEEESEDEITEDEAVQQNMDAVPREANEEEQESDDDSTEGEDESDEEATEEEEESDEDITEEEESSEDEAVAADKSEMQCAHVAVVTQTSSSSPLPNNIATQFPRPSSAKYSGKKQPKIAMCFDTSNEVNKEKDEAAEKFKAKSLRQLKKLVKNTLAANNENTRVALKEVSENTMAAI